MNDLREYLRRRVLIADGATGTYISSLTGRSAVACEMLNLSNPGLVRRIHTEYVRSGAKLILTNTFSANTRALRLPFGRVADIVSAGVDLAVQAAGEEAWVAGDIGPLPEEEADPSDLEREYRRIADVFLQKGVRVFQFETFGAAGYPIRTARYIRSRRPDAFILISFAVTPDGHSRLGHTAAALVSEVRGSGCADAVGFNCCSGPVHMLSFASKVDYGNLIPCISPNAGYPQMEDDVLVYSGMPDYFAEKLAQAPAMGFRILGGCCGTTPEHIRQLALRVSEIPPDISEGPEPAAPPAARPRRVSRLFEPMEHGRKGLIVEVDPPFDLNIGKLEDAARVAKAAGADALTVTDSPMARPRADSAMIAARLRRVAGIEVVPHLCCRDKNINALKSALIAAHIEGIRNVLAVTGDPIPDTDRSIVKSVYNLNSVGLCEFIRGLNADIFSDEPILYGCALNVNALHFDEELRRLGKKVKAGASFVLTQPVYSDESLRALEKAHRLLRGEGVRLYAGIMTPLSFRNATFLANEVPGIRFPPSLIRRFSPGMTREQGEQTGVSISLGVAARAADHADGFYFVTPFNRIRVTARLIAEMKERGLA